ncbi:uncharacterized protein LOC121050587 [Rosa chinensis]|uniref:uncharacterized protein LOC121050587 n=1 Tax=Rosa chinensis TaxID=74649 RepID=UPI001AD8CBFF|nr:uncharacterized protein LOC121050587 [Rosa chinensis]
MALGKTLTLASLIAFEKYGSGNGNSASADESIPYDNEMGEDSSEKEEFMSVTDKGHQNWGKVTGEYLHFPRGGTQFKNGALHNNDFIQKSLPERVILDVGCGNLPLELNHVLRSGGYFVWSATLIYQNLPDDVGIWKVMSELIQSNCWDLVMIRNDKLNQVTDAIYRKPSTNECYTERAQNQPPLCMFIEMSKVEGFSHYSRVIPQVFSSQFRDFILLNVNPCQPTTSAQMFSLRFVTVMICFPIQKVKPTSIIYGMTRRNLTHAALPSVFWYVQMCKGINLLQTHGTIIITIEMGVISGNIIRAVFQPRSFSIEEAIDVLQINLAFSNEALLLILLSSNSNSHVSVHLCAPLHAWQLTTDDGYLQLDYKLGCDLMTMDNKSDLVLYTGYQTP